MFSYFKALSVFLLWAGIALTSHYFISNKVFSNCYSSEDKSPLETVSKELKVNTSFFIKNIRNDTLFKSSKGFTIYKNNSTITGVPNLNERIRNYLNNNYDKELLITGKYLDNEIDTSPDSNLGLQRALSVKRELLSIGVHSYQVNCFGNIFNFSYNKNGDYDNGITLRFKYIDQHLLDSIENNIIFKNLYIEFENDVFLPTKYLEDFSLNLKQYLQKYPEKIVHITGHTDNKGYYQNNLIIGLNRAHRIKEYFENSGIKSNRLIALSKGESEPIAYRYTEEGKAKNRRIEIQIK